MEIIILGAGQVGGSLTETLLQEGHDITLVDINEERLQYYATRLDIRTVAGRCSYPEILRLAGADQADMVIAVTDSDEANMLACQVAYSLFNTPTKIARIRSPHYFIRKELFGRESLPIDVFISPEQIITKEVTQLIAFPGALQVLDFGDGLIKLIGVKPYYGGECVGRTVSDFYAAMSEISVRIVAIFRQDHSIEVTNETKIIVGDEIFFIVASDEALTVMRQFRRVDHEYRRIMIAGGGNIGACIAEALQQDYHVKLIEHNRPRCELLAEQLKNVTVLNAEASDKELLSNENIEHSDVFVAVTNDDEANIIAAMQAKRLGVPQVMSLITRTAYVDLIEGGMINVAISPQQSTIGSILAHVRQGDVKSVYSLRRGAAEVIEAVAHGDKKTSKVVGRSVGRVKLPESAKIGAIIRGNVALIPNDETPIVTGDHVIIFVDNKKHIREVEKCFQVSAGFF